MTAWKTGCDTSACIEVLDDPADEWMHIRSSWDRGTEIVATREEWAAFKQAVKDGKFD